MALLACCGATLLTAPAARAMGFTGLFEPDTWVFSVSNINGGLPSTPGDCNLIYPETCLDTSGGESGDLFMWIDPAGSQNEVVGTWTWTNTSSTTYLVTFNYLVDTFSTTGFASFTIGTYTSGNFFAGDDGFIAPTSVEVGQTVQFKVTVPISSEAVGLGISGFNGYEVPAPLPATGAASAFAFSRRMRRRIRGDDIDKRARRSAPPPGSCYLASHLNLTTDSLRDVAVCFDYPTLAASKGKRKGCTGISRTPQH